jgi:hypothetical protein
MSKTFIPTYKGRDLISSDRKYDAHVRFEKDNDERTVLSIDVFKTTGPKTFSDVESARIEWWDRSRPLSERVAEANQFLHDYGFSSRISYDKKRRMK